MEICLQVLENIKKPKKTSCALKFKVQQLQYFVQTYHQVHFKGVVELQGWDVVSLLKVMNHEQFSVLKTTCALEKLLQAFLKDKGKTALRNEIQNLNLIAVLQFTGSRNRSLMCVLPVH